MSARHEQVPREVAAGGYTLQQRLADGERIWIAQYQDRLDHFRFAGENLELIAGTVECRQHSLANLRQVALKSIASWPAPSAKSDLLIQAVDQTLQCLANLCVSGIVGLLQNLDERSRLVIALGG